MNRKALKYLFSFIFLIIVAAAYDYVGAPQQIAQDSSIIPPSSAIEISQQRIDHILYGDDRGGGHKQGVGKPCKSEFPADWDDTQIIETTKRVAANDNLDWRREDNGYYVGEEMVEGVKVRVVLGPEKRRVITSYPTNVARNPCPANDNRR